MEEKKGYRVRETHQDELEEGGLVDLDELGVEGRVLVLVLLVAFLLVLLGVVRGVLDHFGQDLRGDVRQGDGGVRAGVCRGRTRRDARVRSVRNEAWMGVGRARDTSQERLGGGDTSGDVPSIMFLMVSDLLLLVCEDGDGEVGAGVSGFARDDIGGDVAGARARRVLT